MKLESKIWYHGSPRKFDKLEIGHPQSSRLGSDNSVFLTRDKQLAEAFGKDRNDKDNKGYLYSVHIELKPNSKARKYILPELNDPDKGKECIEIFDLEETIITWVCDLNTGYFWKPNMLNIHRLIF